jgi:DNA-directed RNA polymerase subunit RPC12/RpoP
MVVVRCQHCGYTLETELPVRAIERIRRCARCGHSSLVAVQPDEHEPSDARDAPQREPHEA